MEPSRGLKIVTLPTGCGYGDAAAEHAAGLDALGVPVSWHPVTFNEAELIKKTQSLATTNAVIRDRLALLWRQAIDYDCFLLDMPPPALHQRLLDAERGKRAFTYATWEVDDLPDDWAPALNMYERVFVTSEFNRKIFLDHGVTVPVDVVPNVARKVVPVAEGSFLDPIADDDLVFYTIGVWTTRKALRETIRAYLDTFHADEKVVLVVKTDVLNHIELATMTSRQTSTAPRHLGTSWWALAQILADYANPARVHLISQNIPPRDIDHLHTRGDCYVSLTRGEGWGLPAFDALLFGNPVIMTGWSGQLDYLGDDYPLSVRYSLETTMNAPNDNCHMRSESAHWADADCGHAGKLMRWVFENREQASAIATDRQAQLRKRFAPEVVSRKLAQLMGFDSAGP